MRSTNTVIANSLNALDAQLASLRSGASSAAAIQRWRGEAAAVLYHISARAGARPVVVVLGGTGTGKSTLVNRLLNCEVTAASYRRTFTAGIVAVAADIAGVPTGWLGLTAAIIPASELPARGNAAALSVVTVDQPLLHAITLVDTPDLDGDQPAHHTQAERAFRWADAVVFVVSPEKYQMTELLPYYRLARRFAVPGVCVMNKCETAEMLADYGQQLNGDFGGARPGNGAAGSGDGSPAAATPAVFNTASGPAPLVRNMPLFAVARDDSVFEPPVESNLAALRDSLASLTETVDADARNVGLRNRTLDLLSRLRDHVIGPMQAQRRDVDRAAATIAALRAPQPGVDVNPLTRQLQRRLQQRSVLYLMGPGRMLDRVRQLPGLIARLPRTTWDLISKGEATLTTDPEPGGARSGELPDFQASLVDQFVILQSRIDDIVRSIPAGGAWLADSASAHSAALIDPKQAGKIAADELDDLRGWLEHRWNGTPRDTALLMKLLKLLPGGERLTRWTEAAPYILAVVVAAHHALFGPVDLMVVGGFSLATWLTEKLSNEVAAHARATNRRIEDRFTKLAEEQIARACHWVQQQAPRREELEKLLTKANELAAALGAFQ